MGEAWSDYYAMDYLVTKRLRDRQPAGRRGLRGQVPDGGRRTDRGPFRSMAIDCPVGSKSQACCTSNPDGIQGRLHLRRLPDHRRWSRGARQRRGLGPDPVGHPQGARSQRGRHADHARHVALGRRPDDARHAQRDPAGRPGRLRRQRTPSSSGRSSPSVAWASSPGRSTAPTPTSAEDFHTPAGPKTHRRPVHPGTVTDPTTGDPVAGRDRPVAGLR